MFSGVYWNQPVCPSVCASVRVSVCVQNTTFCQSAGGGTKSHSVTVLVNFVKVTCNILVSGDKELKLIQYDDLTSNDKLDINVLFLSLSLLSDFILTNLLTNR